MKKNLDKQIAKRLKRARREIGWTVREAAEKVGYTPKGIKLLEAGRLFPFCILAKLAEAYRKPIEWFLQDEEPPKAVFLHCRPDPKDSY